MKLTFGGGAGWFYANMHETISEPHLGLFLCNAEVHETNSEPTWSWFDAMQKCRKLTPSLMAEMLSCFMQVGIIHFRRKLTAAVK